MEPSKRISAAQARRHEYFMDLPPKIHDLPDGENVKCCYSVLAYSSSLNIRRKTMVDRGDRNTRLE